MTDLDKTLCYELKLYLDDDTKGVRIGPKTSMDVRSIQIMRTHLPMHVEQEEKDVSIESNPDRFTSSGILRKKSVKRSENKLIFPPTETRQ